MAVSKISSTSTYKTTISDLPELPLLTIFDFIPLLNLLHIDEVCLVWKGLKPAALCRRRHLIIADDPADLYVLNDPAFDSDSFLEKILKDDGTPLVKPLANLDRHAIFLGFNKSLQTATMNRLIDLLPNLKVFRYVQYSGSYDELWRVKQLLTHYRHQLIEVNIDFHGKQGFYYDRQSFVAMQCTFLAMFICLLVTLNELTALRSLELTFQAPADNPVDLDDHQLYVNCLSNLVGRLTHLKFNTRIKYDGNIDSDPCASDTRLLKTVLFCMRNKKSAADKAVFQSLASFKLKPRQQQLQPKVQEDLKLYVDSTPLTLRTLVSLGPGPVSAGLRTVKIDGIFSANSAAEYNALARFARQSPHLQALTVSLKCLCIWRLVESLASLNELVYLNISCAANSPPMETGNTRRLPTLPSVKALKLTFSALSHHDYKQLLLEMFFPNLQTVLWNHMGWGCPDCCYMIPEDFLDKYRNDYISQINPKQFKVDYGRQMTTCLLLARLAAFSRLPKLTHLFLTVRPSNVYLPFKDQMFTNCRVSLSRRAEFVEFNTEGPNPNSSKTVAVYND
ncbi:hypothetical protein TYRP_005490 [Tyrophagus putrescentiae]|nr:hypothetical protein TYRP_005490 [Tyrophagus putrescentiae]